MKSLGHPCIPDEFIHFLVSSLCHSLQATLIVKYKAFINSDYLSSKSSPKNLGYISSDLYL